MIPYLILIAPLFLFAFMDLTKDFHNRNIQMLLFFYYLIFLSLFAGLRYNTGFDYSSYERIFFSINNRSYFGESIEPGYIVLNQIILLLTGNYHVLLTIVTIITIVCISRFIWIYSPYKIYSLYLYVAIYFIGGVTGQMRQAVAVSILTMAFQHVEKREFGKFLFWVLIASLFHSTSFIFIIIYFIYPLNINKVKMIAITTLSIILGYIDVIRFILPLLESFDTLFLVEDFIRYSESRHVGTSLFLNAGYLERIFFIVLIFIFIDKILLKYQSSKVFIWSYMINSGIYFFFTEYQIFARRLSLPFKIVEIILIAMMISVIKNKYLKILVFFVFSIIYLSNLIATIQNPSGHYIPYEFLFNN
ncbi:EpsG family protein [Alteribacter natronophilus]|uniref:EpsG family protein n=1 Tax=Alteribacter natronophilus TaxID=2583810 RepID=UPI00110E062B|nr:EpsG family protein [Alteribacter natronophilus]TMW72246.1 EpsG family protein [Alteribacter natronophilus]